MLPLLAVVLSHFDGRIVELIRNPAARTNGRVTTAILRCSSTASFTHGERPITQVFATAPRQGWCRTSEALRHFAGSHRQDDQHQNAERIQEKGNRARKDL